MSNTSQSAPGRSNIAVLIDGDNAQPALFEKILLEVARYGRPTIRRIYGDWTTPNMNGWKRSLHDHAIAPVQQFRNTVGKNATDSSLIIDAMDILYSHSVRCFCIVSSDSDYTRLATRIREDGIMVIGVGRTDTPQAFVKACDVFIRTENLVEDSSKEQAAKQVVEPTKVEKVAASSPPPKAKKPVAAANPKVKAKPSQPKKLPPPLEILKKAYNMTEQVDGWALLGTMGAQLRQIDPAFDSRTWGYSQLSQLVGAATNAFQIKKPSAPGATGPFVKLKAPNTKC